MMSNPSSDTESAYIEQPATVVDLKDGLVTLSTIKLNTCQQCSMKAGCGQRLLNQASSCTRSQIELDKPDSLSLQVGQEVRVAIPQSTFIQASLWVFLVPLLCMLLGAYVAQTLLESEPAIALSLIHISEPTRLRRISYAVFCLKKKNNATHQSPLLSQTT